MPRNKTASTENATTKPRHEAPHAAKKSEKAVVSERKPRRSPYDVVQELKAKRVALTKSFEERLSKLDTQIERLEKRYEKKLKVSELLETRTPEELAQELEAIKKYQAILKKALKVQS